MMIYGNIVEVLVCGIGPGFENVARGRDGKELLVVDEALGAFAMLMFLNLWTRIPSFKMRRISFMCCVRTYTSPGPFLAPEASPMILILGIAASKHV